MTDKHRLELLRSLLDAVHRARIEASNAHKVYPVADQVKLDVATIFDGLEECGVFADKAESGQIDANDGVRAIKTILSKLYPIFDCYRSPSDVLRCAVGTTSIAEYALYVLSSLDSELDEANLAEGLGRRYDGFIGYLEDMASYALEWLDVIVQDMRDLKARLEEIEAILDYDADWGKVGAHIYHTREFILDTMWTHIRDFNDELGTAFRYILASLALSINDLIEEIELLGE